MCEMENLEPLSFELKKPHGPILLTKTILSSVVYGGVIFYIALTSESTGLGWLWIIVPLILLATGIAYKGFRHEQLTRAIIISADRIEVRGEDGNPIFLKYDEIERVDFSIYRNCLLMTGKAATIRIYPVFREPVGVLHLIFGKLREDAEFSSLARMLQREVEVLSDGQKVRRPHPFFIGIEPIYGSLYAWRIGSRENT